MTASADISPPVSIGPAFFDNFTKYRRLLPEWFWFVGRLLALGYGIFIIWLLAVQPDTGLRLFWGTTIPALPILLVVAPGLWRQVCPMAFLNQLPRRFGVSLARDLPVALRDGAFGIAVLSFVLAVSMRVPFLNTHGPLLAAGLVAVLTLALLGGFVFKGRSGWCGTFCPLGPIQRTYGQAPLLMVPNGFCSSCVGCQKSCYDFNPRAAVFADLYDDDPKVSSQRRIFMGMLPGLIAAYFLQGTPQDYGTWTYLGVIAGALCVSAGFYWILTSFLPVSPYRVSLAFGATALGLFYWFTGPALIQNLGYFLFFTPPDIAVEGAHGIGFAGAMALVGSGLHSEWRYRESREAPPKRTTGDRSALKHSAEAAQLAEVTDRETGITFNVDDAGSLLDAVQAAGLKINYGCRSGVCGADAVAICEGTEHLDPPGEEELETLRRMGLEGRARLACMCKVKGPVTIDRDPNSSAAPVVAADPAEPRVDLGQKAGVSRVVVIGNGVAGMGVAEAVRRLSPSAKIDIVTNEINQFYNRMAIGRLVYSTSGMDGLQLTPDKWYQSNNVEVHRNTVAAEIDRVRQQVHLATGDVLEYDKLVLATGARPSEPASGFLEYSNAFVMRTVEDALAIRAYAQAQGAQRAVVIGGGVLGVEAADALHKLGLKAIILQRADRLMNAQLDDGGAAKLTAYLEGIGIHVATGVSVDRFDGTDHISSAWLSHGPRVRADMFVACLGVKPNTYLAQDAGLAIGRGVRVDDTMCTSDPNIFAVGDVADTGTGPAGLWPIGAAQAKVAAAAMLGEPKSFKPPRVVLQLKCEGIDLRSFGEPLPRQGDEVMASLPEDDAYWRIILRNGVAVGATFVGPPGAARNFTRVIQDGTDLAGVRERLAVGDLSVLATA